jgi:hypothetical protein
MLVGMYGDDPDLERDQSSKRFSHLINRVENGPEDAYGEFKANDASLCGEPPKAMSLLTQRILASIDFDRVRSKRVKNFADLNEALGARNRLALSADAVACPMVYPYLTSDPSLRAKLIDEKIFVATYWPNVFGWCERGDIEYEFVSSLLPLPVDQRYGQREMEAILNILT